MRRLPPLEQLAKAEEQRQRGRERQRQRIIRIAARPSRSIEPRTSGTVQSEVPPAPVVNAVEIRPSYLAARCDELNFGLSRSEDGPLLVADRALTGLSNTLLEAAEFRRTHVVLAWPGEPAALPLAHGLATLRRWIAGDKLGLRTLWYPVSSHYFHPLHDYYVDEATLYALAQKLLESSSDSNPHVSRSCPNKDPLLFAIHAAQGDTGRGLRPTLAELIPHFMSGADAQEWRPAGRQYLSELIRHLDSRGRKDSVRAIGEFLGDPRRAPDAIFGLHFDMSRHAIGRHLRWLARHAPPEVVVLPITRIARARQPNWVSAVQTFRLQVARVFSEALPGAVVVTDEPTVYERLVKYLSGAQPPSKQRNPRSRVDVIATSLLWPVSQGDGLVSSSEPLVPEILPQKFDVRVVDRASSQVLVAMDRVATAEDVTAEGKEALREAVRFLSILSTMCGTRASLTQWINNSSDAERLSETHTWLPYANRVRQLIELGDFGAERPALEQALAAADRLWEASDRGSPMLHEIESEVRERANTGRKLIIVVPSDRERSLLQSYLATLAIPGDTAEKRKEHLAIEVPWTLIERMRTFCPRRVIFAGLYRQGLPTLLAQPFRRCEVGVILTDRNADYLRRVLPIVHAQTGLRRLRPRIESLQRGIDKPTAYNRLGITEREVFADEPVFRRRGALAGSKVNDSAPMWRIELDDGRSESLTEGSAVYVYAPKHSERIDRAFKRHALSDLSVGTSVLVPPVELRDALDDALRAHGRTSAQLLSRDEILAHYHREIRQRVLSMMGDASMAEQDRRIMARIRELAGSHATLPESARYWIDVAPERTRETRWAPPQGPQSEQHFRWFAQVLDFGETEADFYWNHVIQATRKRHRDEGRRLAAGWESLLLDASSMLSYCGLSRDEVARLHSLALQHIRRVVAIKPPDRAAVT